MGMARRYASEGSDMTAVSVTSRVSRSAGVVAEGVVDLLEPVEVEQQEAHGQAPAAGVAPRGRGSRSFGEVPGGGITAGPRRRRWSPVRGW